VTVVQFGAFAREYPLQRLRQSPLVFVREQIGRSGDNRMRGIGAIIDIGQHKPIRIWMLPDFENPADDDSLRVPRQIGALDADPFDPLTLQPCAGQAFGEFFYRQGNIDELFQP